MSEDVKPEVIKRTQDSLKKYFKKPPLSDKLLKKPPFRFIQDIIAVIIKETGFLEGLFTEEELSADISKDKEAKLVFLTKLIDVVKLITGVNLTVRATKIISGQEPAKTNELLQVIGKALDKKVSSKEAIIHYKNRTEKKFDTKRSDVKKSGSKEQASKKLASDTLTKLSRNGQQVNEPEKKKTRKVRSLERNSREKVDGEKTTVQQEVEIYNSLESKHGKVKQHEPLENIVKNGPMNYPAISKIGGDFTDSTSNSINKSQTSRPKSVTSITNESANGTEKDENHKELAKQNSIKYVDLKKYKESMKRTNSGKPADSMKHADSGKYAESVKHKSESDPILQKKIQCEDSGSENLRISNWMDVKNNTSCVTNIIVEKSAKKEDTEDEMVIIEIKKGPSFEPISENEKSVTEEHGYLVAQILKTEQELVNTNNVDAPNRKVEIVWQTGVLKDRESVIKSVGNLRNFIQTLIKFTNPLGKVLDHLQGDIEIMQKELVDYRNQYADVNKLLEDERNQTNKLMHHMKQSLNDIESKVHIQLDKIHQVKINILKNEQQVHRLLNDSA